MSGIGFIVRLVLPAAVLAASAAAAGAQSGADVSAETQRACTPDAMRLCRSVIPDVAKITVCMTQKWAQISPECRAAMAREEKAEMTRRQRARVE
jgi:hypothetical protein